jgi:subtilisin family serine protease
MSFGQVADDPQIEAAIDSAVGHGVVVVAAGGDTTSPAPLFPADLSSEVIAVRALAENGAPPLSANPVGINGIDAPGENLPAVRVQNGTLVEASSDGSSMATGVVTGSVALLAACVHRKPGSVLNQQILVRALQASADQTPFFNLRVALNKVGC